AALDAAHEVVDPVCRATGEAERARIPRRRFLLLGGPVARVRERAEDAAIDPGGGGEREPLLVERRRGGGRIEGIGADRDQVARDRLTDAAPAAGPREDRAPLVHRARVEREEREEIGDRRR